MLRGSYDETDVLSYCYAELIPNLIMKDLIKKASTAYITMVEILLSL